MSENRNFFEASKGIVSEEQIKESEEINKKFMNLPGIQETIERLNSTLLSDRYRYYPQADVIINCLREVFGDYDENLLNIKNDLLYEIGDFMDAYKALEEGKDNPEKYRHLKLHYDYKKEGVRIYLSDNGKKFDEKVKQENPNLSLKEVMKEISDKYEEFIELLEQNLEYVPPKEDKESG